MRQKCVKIASKLRQKCAEHLWGETFWTIPNGDCEFPPQARNLRSLLNQGLVHTRDCRRKQVPFSVTFLLLSAVLRARGRKQNPRQAPVHTKKSLGFTLGGSPKVTFESHSWVTLFRRLFVTCDVFTRYFFVAFSWLFRGPHFGQILRVLALEKSSDLFFPVLLGGQGHVRFTIQDLRWAKSPIASVQRMRSTLASHSAIRCGRNVASVNRAIRIEAQRPQAQDPALSVFQELPHGGATQRGLIMPATKRNICVNCRKPYTRQKMTPCSLHLDCLVVDLLGGRSHGIQAQLATSEIC